MTEEKLMELAVSMMERAYVPYSHFPVGAALECSDGTVFTLIAETSTGKAMKVDGRNCTLEQAMSLLETIVIY